MLECCKSWKVLQGLNDELRTISVLVKEGKGLLELCNLLVR